MILFHRNNMSYMTLNILTFFLFVLFCPTIIDSTCRHSYMTFCDDLDDLNNYNLENWTELVVGKDSLNASKLRTVDFDSLFLDSLEKLTTLIIIGQIKDIKTYTFTLDPYFSKLEYLQLYGNDIKRIRFTTFDTMKLRKLNLVNNNIEYIHKGAFYNCEIASIDLSHNNLENFEKDVFSEEFFYNSTKELVIRHNKLESIEPLSFPRSLEILNLDYNNLRVIQGHTFNNLENLQEFTISHNQLLSLEYVRPLNQVRHIDASHNKIVAITSQYFNNLTQLEVLDLSHNLLSDPIIFKKFNFPERHPSLQVSLVFNRFTHLVIEDNTFRHHIVFLYGNPWNCNCWQILEKFMVDNKVKRNECDLKFFGNGEVPYCIDYSEQDCKAGTYIKNPNITENDLRKFSNIVMTSLSKIKCRLTPRRL